MPGLQFDKQGIGAAPFIRGVGTVSGASRQRIAGRPVCRWCVFTYSQCFGLRPRGHPADRSIEGAARARLFGRNATGGVIQVETRAPEMEPSAELGAAVWKLFTEARHQPTPPVAIGASTAASVSLYTSARRRLGGTNLETEEPHLPFAGGRWPREDLLGARRPDSAAVQRKLSASLRRRGGWVITSCLARSVSTGGPVTPGFLRFIVGSSDTAAFRHRVLSARIEQDLPAFNLVSITSWQNMREPSSGSTRT